jgi:hypothetical protein
MPQKKKSDKGVMKEGEYKSIRVTANLSPIVYKELVLNMDKIGVHTESQYVAMAVKAFNERFNKISLE